MRITITIDETQVTPQALKSLERYLGSRGPDTLMQAVEEFGHQVQVGVDRAKRDRTYLRA
jgi:hypothetical protein